MEIILASFNRGKAREIEKIVSPIAARSLADFGLSIDFDSIENAGTYEGNALIKARAAAEHVSGIIVADDSGLEVDAIGGRPGVLSARYGGADISDAKRYEFLLDEMLGVPEEKRTARFVCCVAARFEDGSERIFTGKLEGRIHTEPLGSDGFGYDPVFLLPGGLTVAQLTPEEKNRISHRAAAFSALKSFLTEI